jgi:multidrug efflux pump subunit AcrA (membrane-fusion protein)
MSFSMMLGRVVLPATAVTLAVALAWHWVQGASFGNGPSSSRAERATDEASAGSPRDAFAVGVRAEGRVSAYPGAEVTVGTEVLGTIVSMPARENAVVRKGDLLAELRSDDVRASLREAHARLIETEVGLRLEQAGSRLDQVLPLRPSREDQAKAAKARRETLTLAQARRDAARAAVDRLEAEAAKFRIVAPIGGVIVARHADPGETVSPAAPLVTIADLTRLRVEAEVDEYDIPRITQGARATITAEGYPERGWRAQVEQISAMVVPRQTRAADPGRPADTRVLIVQLGLLEPTPLKLGQRVEVEILGRDGGR